MGLFTKKVIGCVVFMGRVDTGVNSGIDDFIDAYKNAVNPFAKRLTGFEPNQYFVLGANSDGTYLKGFPRSFVMDLKTNGISARDSGEKHEIYQMMQNFLALLYSNDLDRHPDVIIEETRDMQNVFAVICKIHKS